MDLRFTSEGKVKEAGRDVGSVKEALTCVYIVVVLLLISGYRLRGIEFLVWDFFELDHCDLSRGKLRGLRSGGAGGGRCRCEKEVDGDDERKILFSDLELG